MGRGADDCGTNACNAAAEAGGREAQAAQVSEGQLTAADVYEFLQQNFDTLNTGNDSGISGDELHNATKSGKYSGRDQEIIEFLDATRQYVARLSVDQSVYDSEITMQDAQALKEGSVDLDSKAFASIAFEPFLRKDAVYPATAALILNGGALFATPPVAVAAGSATSAFALYTAGKGIKNYYDQKDKVKGLFSA